jgi:uncharacterized protein YecE (DUF72 family)
VKAVPKGFKFHFKVFGLFPSSSIQINALPKEIRSHFEEGMDGNGRIRLQDLSTAQVKRLWDLQHAALQPALEANKLGLVIFQFHLGFQPSKANFKHVQWCRQHLDPRFQMACEFRCRGWADHAELLQWMRDSEIVLVAADELLHKTIQKDREQADLRPGQKYELMQIMLTITNPKHCYIRVHRRHGNERLLMQHELQAWAGRLTSLLSVSGSGFNMSPALAGPVYFLWGTDWEDQPIINAKNLTAELTLLEGGKRMSYDWKAVCAAQKGTLSSFFGKAGAKAAVTSAVATEVGVGASESGAGSEVGSNAGGLSFKATSAAQHHAAKGTNQVLRAEGQAQKRPMQPGGGAWGRAGAGSAKKKKKQSNKQKGPVQRSTMKSFFAKRQ